MRTKLILITILMLGTLVFGRSADSGKRLEIVTNADKTLELTWNGGPAQLTPFSVDGREFISIFWQGARYTNEPGKPAMPYFSWRVAVPSDGIISTSFTITSNSDETGIVPVPAGAYDTRNGKSFDPVYAMDETEYDFLPQNRVEVSPVMYFRELPFVTVRFYPATYLHSQQVLEMANSARITIQFTGQTSAARRPVAVAPRDESLYREMVLNYDQARNWAQAPAQKSLRKATNYSLDAWYRFTVTEDGLYKITRSDLSAAGIDVDNLDPRTIQVFNHGGNMLNINTVATTNNIQGLAENAIYVSGEADGSFDNNDYVLFYGKALGGWHFNDNQSEFRYVQHPYDTQNSYLLTVGQSTGKRMEIAAETGQPASITDDYFWERVRFEDENVNLLSSGTDWYGQRFYGTQSSKSIKYNIANLSSRNLPARINLRFKGGSGIRYGDNAVYNYCFTTYLNPTRNPAALLPTRCFSDESALEISANINSADYLVNGENTIQYNYTGNTDACNAYLDYVEFYYPRDFAAVNNSLTFFTNTVNQVVNYSVSNLSLSDLRIFDLTDPVNIRMITPSGSVSGGTLNFNLDLRGSDERRIMLSSLTSSMIRTVSRISAYRPQTDLLDTQNQADILVVTHPSFRAYAQELLDLRASDPEPLTGKVVDINEIYHYFSSGVKDPVAIRNFVRYAYYNWSSPRPAYLVIFGDGHYDYRNIAHADTNRVPPYEISANYETNTRETDNFYADVNLSASSYTSITPDLALGRMPVESALDARRMIDKLTRYRNPEFRDGWQTTITMVADDEVTSLSDSEWMHQRDADIITQLPNLDRFLVQKIYLSAYPSVPGGFGRVKPAANQAIIDQLNEGTLLIDYVGHGSPQEWAHENVFDMNRDLNRIQNQGRLPFWVAATCEFGRYDDPYEPSSSEILLWLEDRGAIAVVSAARLVYATQNTALNGDLMRYLFPVGTPSRRLGDAMVLALDPYNNDQKYHLFGDPTMYLADPRSRIQVSSIEPDTLKALSKVKVTGQVLDQAGIQTWANFDGGAFMVINDARYDSVTTGGSLYYTLLGPRIFKGEISVESGLFSGEFIVPKSIRYVPKHTGRLTIYAWNEAGFGDAMGYVDTLLFNGSENLYDESGPELDIYFDGQEAFHDGDLVPGNVAVVAEIYDENGINLTREVGHTIEITIDDDAPIDVTPFFAYERNSYSNGKLTYYLEDLKPGTHRLSLQAWDNLNNPTQQEISFRVVAGGGLVVADVLNYPNPFARETDFTLQAQGVDAGAEAKIKIYTINGRLIRTLDGLPVQPGYNYFHWDGRDEDGDALANGVYIYKIIVRSGNQSSEVIEKLVILK
jgi:hypothetical protein